MSFVALFVLWTALPWLAVASTATFSFTSTAPTECDNLQISWTGGAGAGYYLSILPVYAVPRNISIPDSAFSNGNGSFSTTLTFAENTQFVLTMSDSTGFGAGGSSQKLTVGKSLGGTCNTTIPALAFAFTTPGSLQQCQPYQFTEYSDGVPPVTIMGVIPGGDSFVLHPPADSKEFEWTADVYNGTEVIFTMIDAQLRTGGSALSITSPSSDLSCINSDSPSVTMIDLSPPSSTSTASPSASSSVAATPRSSTGAIAGSVLGALIFLAVLITLGLFFLRQRQEKRQARMAGGSQFHRTSRPLDSPLDLTQDARRDGLNPHPYMSPTPASSVAMFNGQPPSLQGSSNPPAHYQPHSQYLLSRQASDNPFETSHTATDIDPFMDRGGSEVVSAGQRKSGMSGLTSYKPSRYVLHTDAEDDLPVNEDGVVELPPQYSATRGLKNAQSSASNSPLL
ncbi:hypothetical protein DFH09DRAFT_1123188 [Mycena vulgaris]|nr:hypothetical protein DFH09DRAFT_1123188 [Mycena vulgaris]